MMKNIAKIIPLFLLVNTAFAAPQFDIQRTYPAVDVVNQPLSGCTTEVPLPTVREAEKYYQIAHKLWGEKETGLYPHMYALGTKAAKMGDWRAKLLMAELHLIKPVKKHGVIEYTEYNPKQSRTYINELMQQQVAASFYYMALWRNRALEEYTTSPSPASAYMYQSVQMGYSSALMYMANLRLTNKNSAQAQQYIACAAQNGSGRALNLLALAQNIKAKSQADWDQAFSYLHRSAQAGYYASFSEFVQFNDDYKQAMGKDYLSPAFLKRVAQFRQAIDPIRFYPDPYRRSMGRNPEKKASLLWQFTNLHRVLPLPPTRLPAWNGDISLALSDSDAEYYREDYTIPRLEQILNQR